jgi:hypothetical protein
VGIESFSRRCLRAEPSCLWEAADELQRRCAQRCNKNFRGTVILRMSMNSPVTHVSHAVGINNYSEICKASKTDCGASISRQAMLDMYPPLSKIKSKDGLQRLQSESRSWENSGTPWKSNASIERFSRHIAMVATVRK